MPKKLDLGCGPNKKPDHVGVDIHQFPGVDLVFDLGDRKKRWPWPDDSITEVNCTHFFEHLSQDSRVHFMNEVWRVLIPGGKLFLVVPYWASSRAYGDPTHAWPPIGEMTFYYFQRVWRASNAPHVDIRWSPQGFSCDFDFGCGYNVHGDLVGKSDVVQNHRINFDKEAAQDIIGTLTKCDR